MTPASLDLVPRDLSTPAIVETPGEAPDLPAPQPRRFRPVARPHVEEVPLTHVPDEPAELRHPSAPAAAAPSAEPDEDHAAQHVGTVPVRPVEPPARSEPEQAEPMTGQPPGRANLGQSRRLGLGAPIPQPAAQPLGPPVPPEPPALAHPRRPAASEPGGEAAPVFGLGAPLEGGFRPVPPTIPSPTPSLPPEPAAPDDIAAAPEPQPLVHRPEPAGDAPVDDEPPAGGPRAETGPAPAPAPPEPVLPIYRPGPAVAPRPLPKEPSALVVEAPAPAPVRVPAPLASALHATHGVDVSDVKVHRGAHVSAEASALGAVAFARQEEVYLPSEAGHLDQPEVLGLLAHELTHVVQQRTLGGTPREGSPEADRLEAEAQNAERFFRGDGGAPEPRPVQRTLTHPPKPTVAIGVSAGTYADQIVDELVTRGIARREVDGSLAFGPTPEAIETQVSAAASAAQLATATAASGSPDVVASWNLDEYVEDLRTGAVEADRDQIYSALVAQENQRREEAGEAPLDPDFDAATLDRFNEEADDQFSVAAAGGNRQAGSAGTAADAARRARSMPQTLGESLFANVATEFGAEIDFGAIRDRFTGRSESERPAPERSGQERSTPDEGAADTGSFADELGDLFDDRNRTENGRPEITSDDIDLHDLARRMWELTRMELRNELLVDRERWGRLTDFR
jgi:hypothetical protein